MSGIRTTSPAEVDSIREFLARVFRCGLDSPSLNPQLIDWKYYAPRPDWEGTRSFVLESGEAVVSHGCVWPMTFVTPRGDVRGSQIIDWAGSPKSPGAGLLLRRQIQEMVSVSVGIGGSEDTRRIMPRAGYATRGTYRTYARAARPIRQFAKRRDGPLWKRLARAARNAAWTMEPLPAVPDGWAVKPVNRFDDDLPPPVGHLGFVPMRRTAGLLNHLLACPAARMTGFIVEHHGDPVGSLLLSEVNGKTRIADLQLGSDSAADWHGAVLAASHAAAALPETCEIVAATSLEHMAAPLLACGFRECGQQPVFVLDRKETLPDLPLHITPADYDDYFAFDPAYPYVT